MEGVEVSEASLSAGIAQRYATAVFELAREEKNLAAVEKDLDALDAALSDSPDLSAMIASPVCSRDDLTRAVTALAAKMGLSEAITGALGVMGEKRRLFVLPQFIAALRAAIADDKGEVTAEVTAAKAMTKAQQDKLSKAIKAAVGKDVKINVAVDESLIGGLVVKVGSRMIDSSIRSRLSALQNSMKEV
ncbi:MAG: F0F1 ATP synthase subunit delta [Rhodobacterales bacterium]|nr:MAG: F0F1 ATP synthase subunit delta [Rhodobacterales bacterium]